MAPKGQLSILKRLLRVVWLALGEADPVESKTFCKFGEAVSDFLRRPRLVLTVLTQPLPGTGYGIRAVTRINNTHVT